MPFFGNHFRVSCRHALLSLNIFKLREPSIATTVLSNPLATHSFTSCPRNCLLDFLDSSSPLPSVAMSPYPGTVPQLFLTVTFLKSPGLLLCGTSLTLGWVLCLESACCTTCFTMFPVILGGPVWLVVTPTSCT